MASNVDEPDTSDLYELTCTDCSFEATVEGDFGDALEVADNHQGEFGEITADHFVDLELRDYEWTD